MSNARAALADLADRVAAADADGSLSSERAVQLRAVEPLLETLGWDVRGSEVVPAATIGDTAVDYLLTVDDVPAVLVGTVDPDADLEADGVDRIDRGIADGRATRGIATDGSIVVLLVQHDGAVHRRSFPIAELPQHAEALGQVHRSVVARTTAADGPDRAAAAERLADHRDDLVASITDTIVDVADEPVEDDVVAESERTVDALVEAFRDEGATEIDRERSDADAPDGGAGGDADASEPEIAAAGSDPTAEAPSDATATSGDDVDDVHDVGDGEVPATAPDGEYVVRFFGGSSSVGAVGTETPRGTTVGTVRYLLENHGLHSSITLPWRDGDGTVVLAAEPGGDGWTTLSNAAGDSISVRPVDDPETARGVIEELVEAAGLRPMFQGDW